MIKIKLEESNNSLEFSNLGDVNFADGGCLVAKNGENSYVVVKCDYLWDAEEPTWVLTEDYIDITDDWIDREAVEKFADCDRDTEPEFFARAVIDYYGTQSYGEELLSAEEAEARLKSYNVTDGDVYFDGGNVIG